MHRTQAGDSSGGRGQTHGVSVSPDEAIEVVRERLVGIRRRAWAMLVLRRVCLLLACIGAAALLLGLIDYVLRLPVPVRVVLWAGGAGVLVVAIARWILPALRFRPGLTEIALRIERSESGRAAGLEGLLASGLELSESASGGPIGHGLGRRAAVEAARRFDGYRARDLVMAAPAGRGAAVLCGVIVAVLLPGILAPSLAWTGAQRVLTPWADAQWPKRTLVADVTDPGVHPAGVALPLRAAVMRTNRPEGQTSVVARYRVIGEDDKAGPTQRALLTGQARRVSVPDAEPGELYERLIDPIAPGGEEVATFQVEYWFETEDDRTRPTRVRVVTPPEVVSAEARVTPPDYAAASLSEGGRYILGVQELGAGMDERAVIGPVLAGSRIELEIRTNKPLANPPMLRDSTRHETGGTREPSDRFDIASVRFEPVENTRRWRASWTLDEPVRLPLVLRDEYELTNRDEAIFAFDSVRDRPPQAAVVTPERDDWVLPSAVIDTVGEGRDDIGLAHVSLQRQLARPPGESPGAVPEPVGEHEILMEESFDTAEGAPPRRATVRTTLDLATLDVRAGDEVLLTTVARDSFELDGDRHEPVRSSVRRLRVISEQDFVERIRGELSTLRDAARRLDEAQERARQRVEEEGGTPEASRAQRSIGETLGEQRALVDRLQERVERNRLNDETLEGLLDEAGRMLREAAQASDQAARQIDQIDENDPDTTREATDRQERVRDALGRLAEMLDRGEDGWLVRRDLDRLLSRQRELEERTRQIGEQTLGRDRDQLEPDELAELQRLEEAQREASEAASELLADLEDRAQRLRESDPVQAGGMEDAARRGRREQIEDRMRDAADQLADNRTGTAGEQQSRAAEALEGMMGDLDEAERNRDEVLRRLLASVIDSLRSLIEQQRRELAALEQAQERGDLSGLDDGMARLHRNTLGALDLVETQPRDLGAVARPLRDAEHVQGQTVGMLRREAPDAEDVERSQHRSLRLLKEALEEAERLDREAAERERDRERTALRQAYQQALDEQRAIRDETNPRVEEELTRRGRIEVRQLGQRQLDLRTSLNELEGQTEALSEARVFELAHRRLDALTGRAADALDEARVDRAVVRAQQSAMRLLESLIEALEDPERDDEFREGEGGGGGDGQGAGADAPLIPPLAELRLLRAMQQEAYEITREADEEPDLLDEGQFDALIRLQEDLAEYGLELIERMHRPGPGATPPERGQDGGGEG